MRAARQRCGLTQAELARLAGLDVKTVRKSEQGKRIDVTPLSRLAQALGLEVGQLITLEPADPELQERRREAVWTWSRAFDAHNLDLMLSVYHEDAVLRVPAPPGAPYGGVFRGKEAIRQCNEAAWASQKQEPCRPGELTMHVVDHVITLRGELGFYKPNGELIRFPMISVFTFVEHLIQEHEIQYDTLDFARRLDQLPQPSGS